MPLQGVESQLGRIGMSGLEELPEFDWDEIKKHNNKSGLWLVVHDCVYDVTSFLEEVCKRS